MWSATDSFLFRTMTASPGKINMKAVRTEKEVKELLKKMTIICDTREQVNGNITGYLDKNKLPYISRKLDVGDYSFDVDGLTFSDSIAIERKASIDEIAGNFTVGRQRFENEFLRAKANGIKVFLLIEDCSWEKIKSHDYRSKLKPQSLIATLLSWQVRYNISIIFCKAKDSGELIYGTCYYWLKNYLEH